MCKHNFKFHQNKKNFRKFWIIIAEIIFQDDLIFPDWLGNFILRTFRFLFINQGNLWNFTADILSPKHFFKSEIQTRRLKLNLTRPRIHPKFNRYNHNSFLYPFHHYWWKKKTVLNFKWNKRIIRHQNWINFTSNRFHWLDYFKRVWWPSILYLHKMWCCADNYSSCWVFKYAVKYFKVKKVTQRNYLDA